jgi:outer membrane protein, heavy metal efflux system
LTLVIRMRLSALTVGCFGAMAMSGCASYEAKPVDLEATRQAWLGRTPDHESAKAFAQELARKEGRQETGFDPSDGLTLAEAEPVALVFNPELRVARLQANVARATAQTAGLWDDPALGVGLERILRSVDNPWIIGASLDITIPISGRLDVEKAKANKELAAALDEVAAKEWATRAAVRELWLAWSAQRERATLLKELVTRLEDVAGLAKRQEEAGSMAPIETRVFAVELESAKARLITQEASVKEMEIGLKQLLGLSPGAPVTLVPTVIFEVTELDAARMRVAMEQGNPELAAVRGEYAVAEESLRLEVRKQYPDLMLGPGYKNEDGASRLLFNASLPLPLWNQNKQGVAQADARREVARGEVTATYERLASRLAMAEIRYEAGTAARKAVEEKVVPLADAQEAQVREVAGLGRVDPLLILQAIGSQHDAKVRLVDAREAESQGAVRLGELMGPVKVVKQEEGAK